jgi:hypothetical protein
MAERIYDADSDLHERAENERQRYRRGNGRTADWREIELVMFEDMLPRLGGRPLVKGLLEPEQTSVVYGEAGCGKSFFCLNLGLHVAAGLDWFGHRVNQGAVVYVAAEAARGIVNRVAAWRAEPGRPKHLPFAAVTSPIDLCHAEVGDTKRLITLIIGATGLEPLALLIVDTLSRTLAGGNENAPDDMGAFVRSIDRLRDELHCHVAAVHHSGKEQSRGSRGHSLLRCAVDTEIEVIRDAATAISTATVTKQRDGATEGQIAFCLRQVKLGADQDGEPVTSCIVDPVFGSIKTPRQGKLSGAARVGFDQLRNCMADHASDLPPSAHIPRAAKGVTLTLWKGYLEKARVINPEGNPREQFRRIRVTLQERGFIGVWDDFVWLSHAVTLASK